MKCWSCHSELPELSDKKLSFRAVCDKCHAWLHCCRNCRHYKPGLPNHCAIPGTEYVADREASNFCEEFLVLGCAHPKTADPKEAAKKLFRNMDDLPAKSHKNPKSRFDNLFRD